MNRQVDDARLDDAARAGWLYYVAGNTQDQIATKLGVSRQTAQRLVSLAVSEGLIRVRLDHPIGRTASTSPARLQPRVSRSIWSRWCRAIRIFRSTDARRRRGGGGRDRAAAALAEPIVMAIGTGRTLKAAIEQLPPMDCPQHKVVVADRQHRAGRLGRLLQRHLHHGRHA